MVSECAGLMQTCEEAWRRGPGLETLASCHPSFIIMRRAGPQI